MIKFSRFGNKSKCAKTGFETPGESLSCACPDGVFGASFICQMEREICSLTSQVALIRKYIREHTSSVVADGHPPPAPSLKILVDWTVNSWCFSSQQFGLFCLVPGVRHWAVAFLSRRCVGEPRSLDAEKAALLFQGIGLVTRCVCVCCSGVPAVVDFAAMRDAVERLGGDPQKINPICPADLVIDHSVQVDVARRCVHRPIV